MFCIWKNKFLSPQPCISHSVNHFFRNFLVILFFFQMFPGLSSVMLSNYCWNIYCTRIKSSIWFWETWHFNSSTFCHLGIWYIFLVIEFWKISAKYCTHLLFIALLGQIQVLWGLWLMRFERLTLRKGIQNYKYKNWVLDVGRRPCRLRALWLSSTVDLFSDGGLCCSCGWGLISDVFLILI